MALLNLWSSNPEQFRKMHIKQLVAIAGDGSLRDGSIACTELRGFLGAIDTEQLGRHLSSCLENSFNDSGLVLQDLVNELGARLDCDVTPGLYRGKSGQIGFDGIWKFPDGYSLVVEIKTTDAYSINLDTVAKYRSQLIESGKITNNSAILIVVGRQDTGGLEAQVRGSRHAWDVRLISAEKLFQLVEIKESAENAATIQKIRSVLKPIELTRLDSVVDLLATTAADIEESSAEPEEAAQPASGVAAKKLSPVAFNDAVAKRAEDFLKIPLKRLTRTLYSSHDKKTSVRALASKSYPHVDGEGFWYAFHPNYKEALSEYQDSHIAFGCGAPDRVLLVPLNKFDGWLKDCNTTELETRMYWHVHLSVFQDGRVLLHLKKGKPPMDLREYLLPPLAPH